MQDDIFQFDISDDPRKPKFVKSINPDRKAVSDHVLGIKPGVHPLLPEGGFLTTQMGSDIGGAPGGISLYGAQVCLCCAVSLQRVHAAGCAHRCAWCLVFLSMPCTLLPMFPCCFNPCGGQP